MLITITPNKKPNTTPKRTTLWYLSQLSSKFPNFSFIKEHINKLRYQNNFTYLRSENECIIELFKGKSLLEFTERFKTDLDCEE
ncbi:hypothetical protein C4H12_10085 [Capnocytophaga sp. oral taxon 878]|nr:hypothetical protein C4H12_10085 [Capnocytophaga sp. oral taxon 878]